MVGSNGEVGDRAADAPTTVTSPAAEVEVPALFPDAGEFLYVRSIGAYRACSQDREGFKCTLGRERQREVWMSPTQPGFVRVGSGETPTEDLGRTALFIGNRRFTRAELLEYRPSGAEMLRDLQADRNPGQGGDTVTYPFVQITDVLREGMAPPAV